MPSRIQLPLLLWLTLGGGLMAGQGLAKAVNTGELAAVKQALAAGEKVKAADGNGWTPLMWVASLTFGAADRNVPSNLGVLLAEYIARVVRGPKPAAE